MEIQEFIIRYHKENEIRIPNSSGIDIYNRVLTSLKENKDFSEYFDSGRAFYSISIARPTVIIQGAGVELSISLCETKITEHIEAYRDIVFVKVDNEEISIADWVQIALLGSEYHIIASHKYYNVTDTIWIVTNGYHLQIKIDTGIKDNH